MKSKLRREVALMVLPVIGLVAIGYYLQQRERVVENRPAKPGRPVIRKIIWGESGTSSSARRVEMHVAWTAIKPAWWGQPYVTPEVVSLTPLGSGDSKNRQKLLPCIGGGGGIWKQANAYVAEHFFTTIKGESWPANVEATFAFKDYRGNPPLLLHRVPVKFRFKAGGQVEILEE